MVRALALALLSVLLVGVGAAPASAHASLVSTDPAEGAVVAAAPELVTFTFDEPVSLVADGLQAYDAAGGRVEIEPEARDEVVTGTLPDDLGDGTYVVTWRVVSSDGHPIAGSLTFHVGAPSERVVRPEEATGSRALETAVAAVQAASYVGLLVAGGLVVFLGWTLRGIAVADAVRRRLRRLLGVAVAVALGGAAAAVPLSGAYQRGTGLGGVLEEESLDLALVGGELTVLLLVALGFAAALGTRTAAEPQPSLLSDLGALLAVWSPAMVGHTRAYQPTQLLVLTDAVHLSAGALWLGGLAGLVVVLPALTGRATDAAVVLARFSAFAASSLGVLAVTGTLLAWRMLGSWSGLVETTYGRLLLVKIGVALTVAAVAAWNRYRLVPGVAEDRTEDRRRAAGRVRGAVAVEAALLVVLLGVTGFLAQQPPRPEGSTAAAAGSTGVATAAADDLRVFAVLDAGGGRTRQLTVQVQDRTGEPVDLPRAPRVSLSSGDVDLGDVTVRPVAAGTYVADVTFPKSGEWELQVSLRRSAFENPVTTLDLEVR